MTTSDPVRTAHLLAWYGAGWLAFSTWIGQRNPWFGGLLAWLALSVFWTPYGAMKAWTLLLAAVGVGAFAWRLWVESPIARSWAKTVCLAIASWSVVALLADTLTKGVDFQGRRFGGWFGNATDAGIFFALVLPLASRWPLLAAWIAFGIVLAGSTFGLLGGLVGWLVAVPNRWWRAVGLLGGVIVLTWQFSLGYSLTGEWEHLAWRVRNWSYSLAWASVHPIRGWGLGAHQELVPRWPPSNGANTPGDKLGHAHNEVVNALFDLGAVGGVLILGLVGRFWWQLRTRPAARHPRRDALGVLAAFLVVSMGYFPLWLPPVAAVALLAWADWEA